jgi:hypothetical protein
MYRKVVPRGCRFVVVTSIRVRWCECQMIWQPSLEFSVSQLKFTELTALVPRRIFFMSALRQLLIMTLGLRYTYFRSLLSDHDKTRPK